MVPAMTKDDRQLLAAAAAHEPEGISAVAADALAGRQLRLYDYCMAAFAVILICSNLIGASKQAALPLPWSTEPLLFGAGILFFPLGYVLGDVLTEVYGYARARRVVWVGFAASAFTAFMCWAVLAMPAAPGWTGQETLAAVFGQTPRIFLASITAFWAGEFANSFVLARLKLLTQGRWLWMRTIGSTVVGQGVDSLIFYPLAFLGQPDWPPERVALIAATNYGLKVLWEVLLTPVTYAVVSWFKRVEGLDVYDTGTDFTPFKTRV
jgi:queuosine precursor transporter